MGDKLIQFVDTKDLSVAVTNIGVLLNNFENSLGKLTTDGDRFLRKAETEYRALTSELTRCTKVVKDRIFSKKRKMKDNRL